MMKHSMIRLLAGSSCVLAMFAATAVPAAGQDTGMVKLADANIEYFSQGQGDVVVLLPGGSLNVKYMEGLAKALADAGLRAVRINPRDAGKSTGGAKGVTLHDLAGDVAGVIKSLDVGAVNVAGLPSAVASGIST